LGSNFDHFDLFRIWKEIVIALMVPFGVYLAFRNTVYRQWLVQAWLARLILAYLGLTLVTGLWAASTHHVNREALLYSLFANLRYLGFFLLVVLVSSQTDWLKRYWKWLVLLPAAVVVIFGLIQRTLLPYDFLRHFGYGPDTIPAYQTVDNKLDYRRIQSTLRGANPLGAYLVLVISLLIGQIKRVKNWYLAAVGLAVSTLFLSYSRSAYIGTFIAAVMVGYLATRSPHARRKMMIGSVIGVVIVILGIGLFRTNNLVENTLFHTDETSKSRTSSNADRAHALELGSRDVLRHPLGKGPGTAGLASVRNNHPARISENYFLQIGQEVGWLGLGLFIAINILVGQQLWQRRKDNLALALLASLIGLTFVNLLSHAWADDTLGLLWWGLAGIALSPGILNIKRKHHETTEKTS
jgi:uncharacterized membrane protein YjjB (DUF3815 family)